MITLTRRYRFSASHRLHSAELSEAENMRVFGKCNNPFGHGHDYVLEVTIAGRIDEETGLLTPVEWLDQLVRREVLSVFSHRNINLDVAQFASLIPTTENIALVIAHLLQENWHLLNSAPVGGARLCRVHLQETDRNGFEVLVGPDENQSSMDLQESVAIHV